MSICTPHMSANTPVKRPNKESEHIESHPDFTKAFKLINDPALTKCPPPVYRYDGMMPGMKSPIEVTDPRMRFPRTNTRNKNIFLHLPEFIVDKYYVLPIKPKEVSFSNLNNNVNVKFLDDMCKAFGIVQEVLIFYHPITKKHLGLGKVLFTTSSAAQKCVERLNNTSSMGNILKVFLDDKGVERDIIFKELTKDPSKAEFVPPMPNSFLQRDVLLGMFPATSTPTSATLSGSTTGSFTSPGIEKAQTSSNNYNMFSPLCKRSHSLIQTLDHSTNGDANVLQRKSSIGTAGCFGNTQRSSSGEDLIGSSIPTIPNPTLANKSSQKLCQDSNNTVTTLSSSQCQPNLTSPISSSKPFHHRQAQHYNPTMPYNSRSAQKPNDVSFHDTSFKEKPETRNDKFFDYGTKEKFCARREDRYSEKKWSWNQVNDYKDKQNKNGDKADWKDKYSSPNNRKDRNRERKDFYDNSYNRTGWNKQLRDGDNNESPRRAPDNSHSFENLADGSQLGTPGLASSERETSKNNEATEKNGQTPFSDLDDKKSESSIKNNFLDKRSNILANSDDNAIDSSHLFVQHLKKPEPNEPDDDNHESLESRIQALLGQHLPFPLPGLTVQAPVIYSNVLQPPFPPSPSPPLPLPPSSDTKIPPLPPPSIYSFPPPPLTVPLPIVPPNISYMHQNLPMAIGLVPPLVNPHIDPSRSSVLVQWRFPADAISTPPPTMNLPPLGIPPPPLPTQGGNVFQEYLETKHKVEEKAKFNKIFNELIFQLKEVLSKDLKKKMVEVAAFKEFEDWWSDKSKEHNEKLLSSRQQLLKPVVSSLSSADLRNGEQKAQATAAGEISSSVVPNTDHIQTMDTLSGLFDKSGSFAGGLLGLRNMRLTSMPSFRKKSEPPKVENERIKNRDDEEDDDDDDDDDFRNRRPSFRGPRTPEGSENESNISSSSESESNSEHPGRPDSGKGYKPPSPPPSPIHARKEHNKKTKKAERKVSISEPKLQRREIYSSSSSLDSETSRKDYASDGSSDIDVMNLVKKVREPARKFAVYTSDEEEEGYSDGQLRTSTPQKANIPSICSSLDSDSCPEKHIDITGKERSPMKVSGAIKTLTPKQKPAGGKAVNKSQKEEGVKRKYTSRKRKTSVPSKRQRVRSRSTRGDDDDNYVSHSKKEAKATNHKENNSNKQPTVGDRKRSNSLASPDVRPHKAENYDENRPVDGYLHLLSDVASEVKQAEVNKTSSNALFSPEQKKQPEDQLRRSPDYSTTYRDEELLVTSRSRTYSHGDVTSRVASTPLRELQRNLPRALDDHMYSLKPWAEVKSKKGRKAKHKTGLPPTKEIHFEASSGDETVALSPSDFEQDFGSEELKSILIEHSYATIRLRDIDYASRSSDSEVEDVSSEWPQVYVEDVGGGKSGKKFTLEKIPHIGKEVDISFEKPEQEKNINVVDDEEEEEEGEYHTSSDEDKMVIDEGLTKSTVNRKRKRLNTEGDIPETAGKKVKFDKKFHGNTKHSNNSGKLPRELVNLFQTSFTVPESKPAKFTKRDFKEEAFILYEFVTKGIDEEDANYIRRQFEKLHQSQQKMAGNMESSYRWIFETKWIDHPVKTEFDSPTSKKSRKSSKYVEPHKSGAARTEGYYKIPHQAKQYLKCAHGVDDQHSLQVASDEFPTSSISSTSLIATETTLDAMVRKRAHQNREARSEGRRYQNLLTTNLGEDVAELLKFNQLQLRKKQLRFAKSRIHDWGLFAMEPIAEGELVIEYVGQVIRQCVADIREKRYEAEGIGSSYLFRIDQTTIVDATRVGNFSRFINHCCNPNCYAKIVSMDGVKRIVIYSRRDIEVNEEITYDYKFPIEDDKIPCLCGASGCRGTLN